MIFMSFEQENIKRCVCIIYDPLRSAQGILALKALRLTDSFMELYRTQNFNGEKYSPVPSRLSSLPPWLKSTYFLGSNGLVFVRPCPFRRNDWPVLLMNVLWNRLREKNMSWTGIFEEIPVRPTNKLDTVAVWCVFSWIQSWSEV